MHRNIFKQLVKTQKHKPPELKNWSPGISAVFPGISGVFPGISGVFPGIFAPWFLHFVVASTEFNGFHGFGAVQTGIAPKKRRGSDSLNTGGSFHQKTSPMVDTQVIGFQMCGHSWIKFTLGRNRSICLQEGKSAPKGNFRFSLGRSASEREEPLLPLAEEISYPLVFIGMVLHSTLSRIVSLHQNFLWVTFAVSWLMGQLFAPILE